MTVQETITQAKYFTQEQKQQIGYYYLLSALKEDKKQESPLLKLFDIKIDFEKTESKKTEKSWTNIGKTHLSGRLDNVNIRDYAYED